jgi:hypothetical protein
MATIDSFTLTEYGDWLRYRFSITLAGGETLTGYDAWYSDTTSTPDWGDSIDCGVVGQGATGTFFQVLVNTTNNFVDPSVCFEELTDGNVSFGLLDTSNAFMQNGVNLGESYIRIIASETWEDLADGVISGSTITPTGYGFNTWNIGVI